MGPAYLCYDALEEWRWLSGVSGAGVCREEGGAQLRGSTMLQVEEVPTKRINLQGKAGLAPVIIEGAETAVVRAAHTRST